MITVVLVLVMILIRRLETPSLLGEPPFFFIRMVAVSLYGAGERQETLGSINVDAFVSITMKIFHTNYHESYLSDPASGQLDHR
jgi:hypothetical protein